MNGVKDEICCGVRNVSRELTGSGSRTIGSGKSEGRFKLGSLGTSKCKLDVTGEPGGLDDIRDDKGGRGIDSS